MTNAVKTLSHFLSYHTICINESRQYLSVLLQQLLDTVFFDVLH